MLNKKISIIVPCYNQAQYLDECLQSVLDQTYSYWECLIIDDGSPDNTEEVAKKWVVKDARFKYFKKENGGVASARNFGIEKANGQWILPLDGDDKIGLEYLELAEKEFLNRYDLIYCKAEFFGSINEKWDLEKYSFDKLLMYNHIYCSAFFKKSLWLKTGGYDSAFKYGMEDWDFWLSILSKESKVLQLEYNGFFYRRKEQSRDTKYNEDQKKQFVTNNMIYKKHLCKYLPTNFTGIDYYVQQQEVEKRFMELKEKIGKNSITRFLYKVISFLN